MNQIWLEDFLELASCLNFSRAAERRSVTQPAFGRRIKALEDWCGQQLVDRSSHRLSLTPAGELVRQASEDLLRRTSRLRHDLGVLETGANTLIFAATQALSFTFFPNWISRAGGGAAVHLLADNMRACERLMESGRAQFLLCHTHPAMMLNLGAGHYRVREIARDLLVPISALRDGRPMFEPEGRQVPLLAFDDQSGLGRILQATLGRPYAQLDLQPVFTSHVAMALKNMALEGHGIAWLPSGLLRNELATGQCEIVGGPELQVEVAISLIRPKARLSPLAETFWESARHAAAPLENV